MTRNKMVNGEIIALTAEEEAARDAQEAQAVIDRQARINNEPEQSAYAEQRRNAYPPIGDQLDMLWHSINQNPELKQKYFDFYEAIKQVKVKYPKNG